MHGGKSPLYHRDIRWENIIRLPQDNPSKWVLIDWDDAGSPPTQAALHLEKSNHAPEVFKNNHGAEVDIWSVGRLIIEAKTFILAISANVSELGRWMQSNHKNITAQDALRAVETTYSGSVSVKEKT
jgi:hypothetical protein